MDLLKATAAQRNQEEAVWDGTFYNQRLLGVQGGSSTYSNAVFVPTLKHTEIEESNYIKSILSYANNSVTEL